MNDRTTKKERGLIKAAIRRVFSRSEARKAALANATISHADPSRPRVTRWGRCASCIQPTALYQMEVDHNVPVVPITSTLEQMSWDEVVSRMWCEPENLVPLCKPCHRLKSKAEAAQRRKAKKESK